MKLEININQASGVASGLDNEKHKMKRSSTSIQNVIRQCPLSGDSKAALIRSLNNIVSEIASEYNMFEKMQSVLLSSIQMYQANEDNLADCDKKTSITWGDMDSEAGGGGGADGSGADEGYDSFWDLFKWNRSDLAKLIGTFGAIGSMGAMWLELGGTEVDGRYIVKGLNGIAKLVGKGASIAGGHGTKAVWFQQLTGLGCELTDIDTSSVGRAVSSSWAKQFGKDLKMTGVKTADKVKAGANWFRHFLTVALNGVENYEEFNGDLSNPRFWGETAIESGVDIAVGAGAKALSTGIMAALAGAVPVLAPVLLNPVTIDIGAAVMTKGANALCKWATGVLSDEQKDLGEFVADSIYDICDSVGPAINNIKNGISSGWRSLCLGFS